jgi:class 3 adenylate cyclase
LFFVIYLIVFLNQKRLLTKNKKLEEKVAERTKELFDEKAKSDELLLNILPVEVAEELKRTGSLEARQFDEVTVLFTDFVGFTSISEKLSPKELVEEIHYCFKAFDAIIGLNKLEKIKTIGDAYMAVCGMPISDKDHAIHVVEAAKEIHQFIGQYQQERKQAGKPYFEIRMGINSGAVIAGIVGVKKYAYDIWGDTVNTAARMEQNCEPGKINLSGSTFELIKGTHKCTYRGKIEAKNKGRIDMYYVQG